ncbi:putative secreted protein (Por secretion system target) [Nonlabens xylanidelens]|uniref:Putative secreted protein (Por secretion system target) n=1 Tax=Nonlabens xylanidelens TaxID=191564 RepID=A0A2S6IQ42_9FLAO|nr:T9SS type A sorting domain-containing protein [Nonlabens xylanidelens]PPK96374.1 putative secreted protein (Por secretion system target) [Nonlabens xylanidelens]PQJ18100.1 glycosyl hydrolase [Nonlabens xylanidelens]
MNKKILLTSILLCFIAASSYYFLSKTEHITSIQKARDLHKQYVENSPYKETIKLSRSERKALSLPPNAYNERLWELSMNPTIGIPTPYKVETIATSFTKSAPGSSGRAWEERGPSNIGGRTRVVFYDPNDVGVNNGDGIDYNRVFAGGVGGGLWVNDDITSPTSTWNIMPGLAANLNVSAHAIDPNDSMTFYIGTGEQYAAGAAVGNGLYKTTDGGATWTNVNITPAGQGTLGNGQADLFTAGIFFINDIIVRNNSGISEVYVGVGSTNYVSPNFNISNPVNVLGAQNAGLYRSIDSGANWSRIENPSMGYFFGGQTFYVAPNDFEIGADNSLYMGTISVPGTNAGGGRFYKSTDGINWTVQSTIRGGDRVEIAASKTNPNLLYVALQQGSAVDLLVSNDGLLTTVAINEPNDADNSISATDFARGQAFYNLVIEVDPTNDQIVYAAGIDCFRSTDGGNSWSQISKWINANGLQSINAPFVHADIHTLSFHPTDSNQALIGSDGGVSWASSLNTASFNNGSISTRNNGYNVTQFYYGSIDSDFSNGDNLVGGAQDNGTLAINNATPGANDFIEALGGDGAHVAIDSDDNYAVITSQFNNHRLVSYPSYNFAYCIATASCADGGANADGDFINVAELDRNLNYLFSNSRNFNGTNGIDTCELLNNTSVCTTITNSLISTNRPTAMKVSPYTSGSSTLMVGTEFSLLLKVTGANTANPIWTSITGPNFLGSVSDIEFGATESEIYVTMHNYGVENIWYTNDAGATWTAKEGNLPDMPVKTILPNPLLPGEVIIGTEVGIYATSDFNSASPTWQPLINGMTNVKVVDLDLRTSDNTILATTHGRGMFTGKFDTLSISGVDKTDLGINIYPTVSNGNIYITSSEDLVNTNIEIYNLSGQKVFISKSNLSTTETALQLDLKSGFYLVKISSNSNTQTEKIIIE